MNTRLILATDRDAPAAKACNEFSCNGKDDWFLPSKDELTQLFENRGFVGNTTTDNYCSSTQNISSTNGIYGLKFTANSVITAADNYKVLEYLVRPIRTF